MPKHKKVIAIYFNCSRSVPWSFSPVSSPQSQNSTVSDFKSNLDFYVDFSVQSFTDFEMYSVFVGKIPTQATTEELTDIAKKCLGSDAAKIVNVRRKTRKSGNGMPIGFIDVADQGAADALVASMNGHELHGAALNLEIAKSKVEDSADKRAARLEKQKAKLAEFKKLKKENKKSSRTNKRPSAPSASAPAEAKAETGAGIVIDLPTQAKEFRARNEIVKVENDKQKSAIKMKKFAKEGKVKKINKVKKIQKTKSA